MLVIRIITFITADYTQTRKRHAMSYKTLYQDRLLDHFKHSAHKGSLENPTFSVTLNNPLCGDTIILEGNIVDNSLIQCRFRSQGCVISTAAASLLCQKAEGQSIKALEAFDKQTMLDLVGIALGPTRLRCALLALEALHTGIIKK